VTPNDNSTWAHAGAPGKWEIWGSTCHDRLQPNTGSAYPFSATYLRTYEWKPKIMFHLSRRLLWTQSGDKRRGTAQVCHVWCLLVKNTTLNTTRRRTYEQPPGHQPIDGSINQSISTTNHTMAVVILGSTMHAVGPSSVGGSIMVRSIFHLA